jgi:hypothetical protein
MVADNIRRSAQRTFDAYAVHGISVEGVIDQTVLEAYRASERVAGYRQIRLSTFGRLRTTSRLRSGGRFACGGWRRRR